MMLEFLLIWTVLYIGIEALDPICNVLEAFNYNFDNCSSSEVCNSNIFSIVCDATNTNFITLDLGKQSLTGTLSTYIGNLTDLLRLNLSSNAISGPIIPEIGNLALLTFLSLEGNNFQGSVPDSFCKLTALADIDLCYSDRTGCSGLTTIPRCLVDLNSQISQLGNLEVTTYTPSPMPTISPSIAPSEAPISLMPSKSPFTNSPTDYRPKGYLSDGAIFGIVITILLFIFVAYFTWKRGFCGQFIGSQGGWRELRSLRRSADIHERRGLFSDTDHLNDI